MNYYKTLNEGFASKYGIKKPVEKKKEAPAKRAALKESVAGRSLKEAERKLPIQDYISKHRDEFDDIVNSATGLEAAKKSLNDFVAKSDVDEADKKDFANKIEKVHTLGAFYSFVGTYMTGLKADPTRECMDAPKEELKEASLTDEVRRILMSPAEECLKEDMSTEDYKAYYDEISKEEFMDYTGDDEDTIITQRDIREMSPGSTFIGYLKAKPEYEDVMIDNGEEIAFLVDQGAGPEACTVAGGDLYPVELSEYVDVLSSKVRDTFDGRESLRAKRARTLRESMRVSTHQKLFNKKENK